MKAKEKKSGVQSRPRKVTIKFFLNKAVQPEIEGRIKRYPLYTLITYDRKNTMLRCHYGKYYKDLDEVDKVHYPGLLAMEERIIQKTITYVMTERGYGFDLKGINKKYERYCIGVHELLETYLKNQLWNILIRLEPYEYAKALNFGDPNVSFDRLYKICKKIYNKFTSLQPKNFEREIEIYSIFSTIYQGSFFNYTFPTVIEWLDNSAIESFTQHLKKNYNRNLADIKKSIGFIDRIVRGSLE